MIENMKVRRFKEEDAQEVRNLIVRNFLEVNSKDYGISAMEKLAKAYDAEKVLNVASYAHMYVFEFDGKIIGTGCWISSSTTPYMEKAPVPYPPVLHSLASASTIAWLIHQKFELSIPLYRQEKEWEALGLRLSRATMSNWLLVVYRDWLVHIVHRLKLELLKQRYLHIDETHMVDMAEVEKDEVPGNPYRVQEDVEVENTVLDDAMEADVITEPKFESVVDDELETEVETFAETAVTGLKTVGKTAVTNAESVVKTDIDVMAESIESGLQNDDIRQIYYRRRLTVEIWSILPGLSCLTR